MNQTLPVFLLSLGIGLSLISCTQIMQQQQKTEPVKEEAAPEIPPPLYLGTVHQVFPADKFVLLRIIGPMPEEGAVLITHPADGSTDRVANLIVSSAQHARNNIVAADIRAGQVMKGDRVFKYRSIAAGAEEEEEEERTPITLTDTELDVGYTPPAIKEQLETTSSEALEEEPETTLLQTADTSILPTEEPLVPAAPDIPSHGHLDDIPDNINDWDSM